LLQRPVALVDIPGFSDPETGNAAEYALTSCQLKVLVIDAADVEREDAANYGDGFDGAHVLPIINRCPGDPDSGRFSDLKQVLRSNIKTWAPQANCLEPLLIPLLHHEDVTWDEVRLGHHMVESVAAALGQIHDLPAKAAAQTSLHIRRFRSAVRRELPEFGEIVERVSADLEQAVGNVRDLSGELLGDDKAAATAVRLGMRAHLVDRTSAFFFPYRSVLRLLALTSGAWDSAALGLSGSLPSLALAAVQSVRNTRHHDEWSHGIESALQQRLEREAVVEATPVVRTLCREIERFTGAAGIIDRASNCTPTIGITGVSALQEDSRRLFSEAVRQAAPSSAAVALVAGLGTAIFFVLMSAPLTSLYANFTRAAAHAFQLQSTTLTEFPVFHPGVLVTALALSLLPVFVIAGIMLTIASNERRVGAAVASLRDAHRELVTDSIESGRLRIRTENPKIEAAQWLGRFLRDQKSVAPEKRSST
jgi:hypothetical protein